MIVDRMSARRAWSPAGGCHREEVELQTQATLEFVDVTRLIAEVVERSGVTEGLVSVQSLHTTAGVVVNENEPLLLEDLRATLERAAPRRLAYLHDEMDLRAGVPPDEPANGHAHCQALFLRASETLAVAEGRPRLGRWQRVFLVELDGPRTRMLSLTVLGAC
jgi:secondary thiamine-phosphate synthase enzyme